MVSLVRVLFVASCLLSIVSFYTTERGMALYLSGWMSFLAALGVQLALVMVAWLIGMSRGPRGLLIAVYAITASISIAFSYVSLYTWFTVRERPALVRRALFDELNRIGGDGARLLTAAETKGGQYALAIEEMAQAEKAHGHISRAKDADPFLDGIRKAVAEEARTYAGGYSEGAGEGVRYTAFDRHAKLTRSAVEAIGASRLDLERVRASLTPSQPAEEQLREFRAVYDRVPWADAQRLAGDRAAVAPLPASSDYVEASSSGQEDLSRAFEELAVAPGMRHTLSLLLAAFIDVIVFLLAFAAGPYLHAPAEGKWIESAAAIDGVPPGVLLRELLAKARPGVLGSAELADGALTPGERHLCLLLEGENLAAFDGAVYSLPPEAYRRLAERVNPAGPRVRTAPRASAAAAV